jgi:peptidoglycan hydrolase-like protein with peptidoglycan-binding domain
VPGIVFAGTTEGFWRSDKGGDPDSWMVTTSRQLEINSIAVHPSRPDMIFIGTNNYGVMVSNDGGKSFVPTNGGFSGRFANAILADRETPNRIYASTINTATGGGFFFVSNDNGESWRPSMRSMPSRLITYAILQDARDANVIYLGTNLGVYRSLDRGVSWSPVWAVEKKKMPVQKGKRQGATKRAVTPKRGTALPNEAIIEAQEALAAAGYYRVEPDGKTGPATTAALKKFQSDRHLPVTGKLDAITLGALGIGKPSDPEAGEKSDFILSDAVHALVHSVDPAIQEPAILAATATGLYRSVDPSKGWQKLSYGSYDPRTTCISTNAKQPETIWVGTPSSGVLISRDSGKTWRQLDGVPRDVPINTIAQDPQRPDYVYVGTKQALFMSHDGGASWKVRGGNLPFGDFTSILINPRNGDEIFAGNAYQISEVGGGVYRSTNGGLSWARIDPKGGRLPSQRIWALAFDAHDQNVLFVGSHSAGVYVVPRSNDSISAAQ